MLILFENNTIKFIEKKDGSLIMFENLAFIFKILFLVLSIMWAGNILLFRSERQIVINPVLIIIASILVILPEQNIELFGMECNDIRNALYISYCFVVVWGIIITRKKPDIF